MCQDGETVHAPSLPSAKCWVDVKKKMVLEYAKCWRSGIFGHVASHVAGSGPCAMWWRSGGDTKE